MGDRVGVGLEFGSDSQAKTPFLQACQMALYHLGGGAVVWPLVTKTLEQMDSPPAWHWVAVGPGMVLALRFAGAVNKKEGQPPAVQVPWWWSLPGPLTVALLHTIWPPAWWWMVAGPIATALVAFFWYGRDFLLDQREWPWEVLRAKTPHPPAPPPERPIIVNPYSSRLSSLPALAPGQALSRVEAEERMNWEDLRFFVQRIDHGEPSSMRHWTDPPRMMPSGREMTRPRWELFTRALLAVGAAVKTGTHQTATVELCCRFPAAMAKLRRGQE